MDEYKLGFEVGVDKAKKAADTVAFSFILVNFIVVALMLEFDLTKYVPFFVGLSALIENALINYKINEVR